MQTILNDLVRGDARAKLAVISDLLSIVGVSLAAVLAPIFAGAKISNPVSLLMLTAWSLAILGLYALGLSVVLVGHSWIKSMLGARSSAGSLLLLAYWLAMAAVFIATAAIVAEYLVSFRG